MEPITLAEFKRLKWVQSAEKEGYGYLIKTRKNSLKTTLTHTVKDARAGYGAAYDGRYNRGNPLPQPYSLTLPQYYIHLRSQGFDFTFAKDPGAKADTQIGFTPTYQGVYDKRTWETQHGVCYGNSGDQYDGVSLIDEYQAATSWKERLIIAAVYLQSAEPQYGLTWYRTSYAVRLGLVGDEFIEKPVVPATVVVQVPAIDTAQQAVPQTGIEAQMLAQQADLATQAAHQQNNATANPPRGFIWNRWIRGTN